MKIIFNSWFAWHTFVISFTWSKHCVTFYLLQCVFMVINFIIITCTVIIVDINENHSSTKEHKLWKENGNMYVKVFQRYKILHKANSLFHSVWNRRWNKLGCYIVYFIEVHFKWSVKKMWNTLHHKISRSFFPAQKLSFTDALCNRNILPQAYFFTM